MAKKLTERQAILLQIVNDHCDIDWATGKVDRFFVPSADMYFYGLPGDLQTTYVSGSGDASCFRALEKNGMIRRPKTDLPVDYCYEITEEGLLAITRHLESLQ